MVGQVSSELRIWHPLIGPGILTIFDHAFAGEEYASVYFSYLLGFVFAHALESLSGTPLFWNFWKKDGPLFVNEFPLGEICVEDLIEAQC